MCCWENNCGKLFSKNEPQWIYETPNLGLSSFHYDRAIITTSIIRAILSKFIVIYWEFSIHWISVRCHINATADKELLIKINRRYSLELSDTVGNQKKIFFFLEKGCLEWCGGDLEERVGRGQWIGGN